MSITAVAHVHRARALSPFARLWTATLLTNLGDGIRAVALPLAAAGFTRDPAAVAGVFAAGRLPWLLTSALSGTLVDRWDRRPLLVTANWVRAGLLGLLAVGLATGGARLWMLYVAALVLGVLETVVDNTTTAVIPALVRRARPTPSGGDDGLERANGRIEAAILVGNEFAGPALGGLLFAAALALPSAVDAGAAAVAAVLLAGLPLARSPRPARPAPTRLRHELAEGVRFLSRHDLLRTLSVVAATVNLVVQGALAVLVLFVLQTLDLPQAGYGLMLVALAIGSLAGSVGAARIAESVGRATVPLAVFVCGVGLLTAGTAASPWVAAVGLALLGCSGAVWNVVTVSWRQRLVPDRLLGRVQGAHRTLSWGAMPVGALLGGLLARTMGLRAPFVVGGLVLLAVAVPVHRLLRRCEPDATRPSHPASPDRAPAVPAASPGPRP